MKKLFLLLIIFTITNFSLLAKEKEKEVKTFDFDSADITGNKTKPAGSNVDILKSTDMKTKIKPREDFLSELSSSVDEL
jgi:hypothetical protein